MIETAARLIRSDGVPDRPEQGRQLCVIDTFTLERVERHRLLVRPQRSTISPFCTQLTGLRPQDVEDGLTFRDACMTLERQHRASSRSWVSWGSTTASSSSISAGSSASRSPSRRNIPTPRRRSRERLISGRSWGCTKHFNWRACRWKGVIIEGTMTRGTSEREGVKGSGSSAICVLKSGGQQNLFTQQLE